MEINTPMPFVSQSQDEHASFFYIVDPFVICYYYMINPYCKITMNMISTITRQATIHIMRCGYNKHTNATETENYGHEWNDNIVMSYAIVVLGTVNIFDRYALSIYCNQYHMHWQR